MPVRSYRDLLVWQKGFHLAADVYRLTRTMPKHEEYRISGQMIRAATSIASILEQADEVGRMLTSLRARLVERPSPEPST